MNSKRARVVLNSLVKGGQGDKAGLTGRALKVSSIDRAAPAPKRPLCPPQKTMVWTLYYFRPSSLAPVFRGLRGPYKVMSIEREGADPDWTTPAVLLADAARDDLGRIEKVAPKADAWCIIYLL